jgi:hypothetical protein
MAAAEVRDNLGWAVFSPSPGIPGEGRGGGRVLGGQPKDPTLTLPRSTKGGDKCAADCVMHTRGRGACAGAIVAGIFSLGYAAFWFGRGKRDS